MLDQNTDRMWFVIGAVIVGAAIIFIANGSLPTLFASVADSFEEATSKGTAIVDGMSPELEYIYVTEDMISESTHGGIIEIISIDGLNNEIIMDLSGRYSEMHLKIKYDEHDGFKENTRYIVTYSVEEIAGELVNLHTQVQDADFQLSKSRSYHNGQVGNLQEIYEVTDRNKKHQVKLDFVTAESIGGVNSLWIRPNAGIFVDVTVRVSNIRVQEFIERGE